MALNKEKVQEIYNRHIKTVFGVDLKEEQTDAIFAICSGKHVIAVLPTGYGKSLIFSSVPLIMDKVRSLVVPTNKIVINRIKPKYQLCLHSTVRMLNDKLLC